MSSVDTSKLQALGTTKQYDFNGPHAHLLERFANPFNLKDLAVPSANPHRGALLIKSQEFTSLCPLTGQPDFATIVIEYTPADYCVESKSLKLYLGSFRNVGEFHESCIARIGRDLVNLMSPVALMVRGEFTPRGGIPFWPTFTYQRPEQPPEAPEEAWLQQPAYPSSLAASFDKKAGD